MMGWGMCLWCTGGGGGGGGKRVGSEWESDEVCVGWAKRGCDLIREWEWDGGCMCLWCRWGGGGGGDLIRQWNGGMCLWGGGWEWDGGMGWDGVI